jgi:hypothetical protein
LESQHKAEIASADAKYHEELENAKIQAHDQLVQATLPLQKTVEDLTFKVASIERTVTGSGPKYLDVTTLPVGPETIGRLGSKFRRFGDGEFYEAAPDSTYWIPSETNEFALQSAASCKQGDTKNDSDSEETSIKSQLMNSLKNSKIYLWSDPRAIKFQVTHEVFGQKETYDFCSSPSISVQRWDQN